MTCQRQWRSTSPLIQAPDSATESNLSKWMTTPYIKTVYCCSSCRQPIQWYNKKVEESFGDDTECRPGINLYPFNACRTDVSGIVQRSISSAVKVIAGTFRCTWWHSEHERWASSLEVSGICVRNDSELASASLVSFERQSSSCDTSWNISQLGQYIKAERNIKSWAWRFL